MRHFRKLESDHLSLHNLNLYLSKQDRLHFMEGLLLCLSTDTKKFSPCSHLQITYNVVSIKIALFEAMNDIISSTVFFNWL